MKNLWKGLDSFKEKEKVWEIRIPPLPDMMMGAGVARNMGREIKQLKVNKGLPRHGSLSCSKAGGRRK